MPNIGMGGGVVIRRASRASAWSPGLRPWRAPVVSIAEAKEDEGKNSTKK